MPMTPQDRPALVALNPRAVLYAESCARVFHMTCDEARANVRLKRRTAAQAYATAKRKYDGLRRDYFARVGESTEAAWTTVGPAASFAALYDDLFPALAKESSNG